MASATVEVGAVGVIGRGEPHLAQNFWPGWVSALHWGQFMVMCAQVLLACARYRHALLGVDGFVCALE
jgi:hypothetical protein